MSTYWGYVCESHDPPLASDHWFNRGDDTLADVYRQVRAGTWPTTLVADHCGYRTTAPIEWLHQHPHCRVALHSEYGEHRPIPPGDPT